MPPKSRHPEDFVKTLEQAKAVEFHEIRMSMVKVMFTVLTISFISFNLLALYLIYKNNAVPSTSNYVELFKSAVEVFKIAVGAS